jgi:hypothetical protein
LAKKGVASERVFFWRLPAACGNFSAICFIAFLKPPAYGKNEQNDRGRKTKTEEKAIFFVMSPDPRAPLIVLEKRFFFVTKRLFFFAFRNKGR